MKLETTAGMLKAALNAIKPAIERRNTIPILSMVKFDGKTIEGTNLDMWIKVDLPARLARGSLCVPFHPLLALIGHVAADQVVTLSGDAEGAVLAFGQSSYEMLALEVDDFPGFDPIDAPVIKVDGDAMKRAIAYVAPAISTEETRYYLNGVWLEGDVAVATDGHRLGSHPLGFSLGDAKGIVPVGAVRTIMAMPPATSLQIDVAKVRFVVKAPGITLSGKLIDGTFPDWRRVVPTFQNEFSELRADKTVLRQVLARLAALDSDARSVTLAWQDDTLAPVTRSPHDLKFGREQIDIPVASIGGAAGSRSTSAISCRRSG